MKKSVQPKQNSSAQPRRRRWVRILASIWRGWRSFWRWYFSLYRGRSWWFRLWVIFLSVIGFTFLYAVALTLNLFWLFGKSPSPFEIMNPRNPEASELYYSDGTLIGKLYDENRTSVPMDSIAPVFFKALVDTEDERFYSHHGIDFHGLAAAGKDAIMGHPRGASTITQQLVKNMFRIRTQYSTGLLGYIPGVSILIKKSKEMLIAVELELLNDKDEILTMYANTVDFGSNAYGIKTAARTYFNKEPRDLKTEEAAVLVGLLKATSTYNPRINPEASLRRRNVVLENMYEHQHLSRAACDSLQALPIELHFTAESKEQGDALYFREAVARYIEENCPDVDPYSDGLKIYTTLDKQMQRYAEQAVTEHMRSLQRAFNDHVADQRDPWRDENGNVIPNFIENIAKSSETFKILQARYPNQPDKVWEEMNRPHEVRLFDYNGGHTATMSSMDSIRYMVKFLHTGFVAMEPSNGYVRAYVGDVNYKTWKYDKVKAQRQPGSTFKLFVYAAAMQQGFVPNDSLLDAPIEMQIVDNQTEEVRTWSPRNANGTTTNAYMTLRRAFAKSVNTVAVRLGQEVGVRNVIDLAHQMGIDSKLSDVPSLPLGSSDVNLLEMVNAYATVANGGKHVPPVLVERIIDRNGHVIYQADPPVNNVLRPRSAFYMQQMLRAGVFEGGTSSSLLRDNYMGRFADRMDIGGKTGTTNNYSDAWFIGVTPNLVGGVWVGGEYRSIHFRSGGMGQGARAALPIFGIFMRKVLSNSRLAPRYLRRFPPLAEYIDPSTYSAPAVAEPDTIDSLLIDSLLRDSLLRAHGVDTVQVIQPDNPEEYQPPVSDESDMSTDEQNSYFH